MNRLARFVKELHRRKVVRTAGGYAVVAFVIIQVVSAVFPTLPLPDGADTLVVVLLALGFPIALVLAWALELTPQGLREEMSAAEAEALAAIKELRIDSVAVLPFENLSAGAENEYFSDGVTEDIIASIARIPGIRVLSRHSVLRFKGERRALDDIARELGVATVVTGSVRRDQDRLRIVAQVLDARDDSHRWSATYDRAVGDVFQIQSEVAGRVAEAVRQELPSAERAGIEARGTTDAQAYDLYLRARFHWNNRDPESLAQSIDYYRRALERDPDFALAHAGLADAYVVLGIYGAKTPADVYPAARSAAAKALAIDPRLGEAVASGACVAAIYDWDWPAAEAQFRRAIELAPSYATGHQWYAANLLTPRRRFTEALAALDRAAEIDALSPAIATTRGIVHFYARSYSEARDHFRTVLADHPRFGLAHHFQGMCYAAEGRMEEALTSAEEAVRRSNGRPETRAAEGYALARSGRTAEAERVLIALRSEGEGGYVSPVLLAHVLTGLGRSDEALAELARAVRVRASDLLWIAVRPEYDALAGAERFRAILGEIGLSRP